MTDRVPLYHGRVSLSPVAGQDNVFDLAMADGAVIAGTPLNKATFLKDATAALFGLGASALPDDVFSAIASGYAKIEIASYAGTGTFGVNNPSSITFGFAPKMVFAICQIGTNSKEQFFGNARYVGSAVMISDALSTAFSTSKGFIYGANTGNYGKKSVDGKTFYWYAGDEDRQLNYPGYDYYFLAIG